MRVKNTCFIITFSSNLSVVKIRADIHCAETRFSTLSYANEPTHGEMAAVHRFDYVYCMKKFVDRGAQPSNEGKMGEAKGKEKG